jgi:hydroxymethylbilane synthase
MERVRIASRGSELALWQARHVAGLLSSAGDADAAEVVVIRTTGDKIQDVPLARIGGRGLFTKELDEALLDGRADLAVHSLKDVPTVLPEGLVIGAVLQREDPRDVLLCRPGVAAGLDTLRRGAIIGTSSLRRRAQLGALRPDLEVRDLRGNLNTRLAKLDAGGYDAIILAAAGVLRLGWRDRITAYLPLDHWLPAVGQGALAVVCTQENSALLDHLASIQHPATAAAAAAERAFLRSLEGGCQVPIGALATVEGQQLRLSGLVASANGERVLRQQITGAAAEAASLGAGLAERLIRAGAAEILAGVRHLSPADVPAPAAP